MKMILKSSLVTMLLTGAAALVPTAGIAGVEVSVGVGAPVYAPGPGYVPYDGQVYYDPIYFGGAWYHGPYRWRVVHGQRVFWVDGGWHRNEWRGRPIPASLTFRNGGYFRSGRYDGFEDAERINARYNQGREMEHGDRDTHPDRADMRNDRDNTQNGGRDMQDRGDMPHEHGEARERGSDRQDRGSQPRPSDDDSRPGDSGPPPN